MARSRATVQAGDHPPRAVPCPGGGAQAVICVNPVFGRSFRPKRQDARTCCPRCRKAVFRHQIAAPDSVVTHPGYPTISPDPVTLNRADPPDAVLADENVIPLGPPARRHHIRPPLADLYVPPMPLPSNARRWCPAAGKRLPPSRSCSSSGVSTLGSASPCPPGASRHEDLCPILGVSRLAHARDARGKSGTGRSAAGTSGNSTALSGCRDGLGIAFGGLKPDDQDRLEVAGFR